MRSVQFAEAAGLGAHAVRPSSYVRPDALYDYTTYSKVGIDSSVCVLYGFKVSTCVCFWYMSGCSCVWLQQYTAHTIIIMRICDSSSTNHSLPLTASHKTTQQNMLLLLPRYAWQGAEICRMYHTLLGPQRYAAAVMRYFDSHDGQVRQA